MPDSTPKTRRHDGDVDAFLWGSSIIGFGRQAYTTAVKRLEAVDSDVLAQLVARSWEANHQPPTGG